MKTALINGITGQDGAYLTRLLIKNGYRVAGTARPGVERCADRQSRLPDDVELHPWDMRSEDALKDLLEQIRPQEFYNFAAFSTGVGMWDDPVAIGDTNGLAVVRILEAIRRADPAIRFCQASSSEMFGEPVASPQTERTSFNPRSPYGAAKLYAHNMIGIYRQRFDMFACSAILFNHESPYRTEQFVTRKVTRAAAAIRLGLADHVTLGDLEARRDWGFAGDSVAAMHLMLQAERPDDFVVATGETHSVRDLCETAFARVGLDYLDYVRVSAADVRTREAKQLVGDASKARQELAWSPTISFTDLIHMMVDADLAQLGGHAKAGT